MNENFGALNLSPSMAESFIGKVEELQSNLLSTQGKLSDSWKGGSFDHLSSAIGMEHDKLAELQDHFVRIRTLIELVNEHNEKRRRREALKQEISDLYGRLTYETKDEITGKTKKHERPEVRDSINRKEAEVEEINRRLDQIVTQIDATTSI